MKMPSNFAVICTFAVLLSGCVNIATSQVESGANLTSLKTMYVKQVPADKRGVNELIADKLRTKGEKLKQVWMNQQIHMMRL